MNEHPNDCPNQRPNERPNKRTDKREMKVWPNGTLTAGETLPGASVKFSLWMRRFKPRSIVYDSTIVKG